MAKNRIKELRTVRKLTQKELATKLNMSQSHIAMLESGERSLDIDLMESISKVLGVNPYELLPQEWQPTTNACNNEDLAVIIEIVETHLQQAKADLSPEHKAKLIILLLDMLEENPANENLKEQISNTINVYTRAVSA